MSTEDSSDGNVSSAVAEFRAKRGKHGDQRKSAPRLSEEEYELIARDIMAKPPFSGYLKYHLPLKYAARCDEVRWQWVDEFTGRLVHRELIGGGKNSDLEFD
jgi:hypothetical protein